MTTVASTVVRVLIEPELSFICRRSKIIWRAMSNNGS
jgi:hypothetical protein